MRRHIVPGLDFDDLVKLAQKDPGGFETLRRREVQRIVDSAPDAVARRLEGLQWRIEVERERAATPLDACARISEMMWAQVLGEDGLLEQMRALGTAATQPMPEPAKAEVLPWRTPEGD